MTVNHIPSGTVRVAGEIDMGSSPQLERELLDAIGGESLVVDLREVRFLDSTAIEVLLAVQARVRTLGSSMVLVPNRRVRRLLEVLDLDDRFEFGLATGR